MFCCYDVASKDHFLLFFGWSKISGIHENLVTHKIYKNLKKKFIVILYHFFANPTFSLIRVGSEKIYLSPYKKWNDTHNSFQWVAISAKLITLDFSAGENTELSFLLPLFFYLISLTLPCMQFMQYMYNVIILAWVTTRCKNNRKRDKNAS